MHLIFIRHYHKTPKRLGAASNSLSVWVPYSSLGWLTILSKPIGFGPTD